MWRRHADHADPNGAVRSIIGSPYRCEVIGRLSITGKSFRSFAHQYLPKVLACLRLSSEIRSNMKHLDRNPSRSQAYTEQGIMITKLRCFEVPVRLRRRCPKHKIAHRPRPAEKPGRTGIYRPNPRFPE